MRDRRRAGVARLDVGKIDWLEVTELAQSSYRLVAPKRLAALAETPG
jgi:hypothetical protein